MAKNLPSPRAEAFKAWMKRNDTNTKRVAEAADVKYSTLASFVQGDTQSLKGDTEQRVVDALGVSADELFGGGPGAQYVPILGRVGANTDAEIVMTTRQDAYDFAPLPPGGTTDSVAVEVHGHSMHGYADDGSLIYFETQETPPTPDMVGHIMIVQTGDGRVLVKRLMRSEVPGRYDLQSIVGPPIEDVEIVWAAEPTAIIPPRQARKIIKRGSVEAA